MLQVFTSATDRYGHVPTLQPRCRTLQRTRDTAPVSSSDGPSGIADRPVVIVGVSVLTTAVRRRDAIQRQQLVNPSVGDEST